LLTLSGALFGTRVHAERLSSRYLNGPSNAASTAVKLYTHTADPYTLVLMHRSTTSLRSASYVSCKRGTARIYCRAPCYGPVLLRRRPCSNRSIRHTRRAHSSKLAARCCSGRMGQTDRRTPYRCTDPTPHTSRAVPITEGQ